MKIRARIPQIALIGFPILERRTNPVTHALASLILENKSWEIALAAREGSEAIRLAEKVGCHGALVRLTAPETARAARKSRIPVVNVSACLARPGVATVKCDNAAIGRLAASHLVEKNFKRLAVILVSGGAFNQDRSRGFLKYAADARLSAECFDCRRHTSQDSGLNHDALARWLRNLTRPVGLFLTDDIVALKVGELLRECEFSVPHDVGIVCGPLHPERGAMCTPGLTTIDPNTVGVYQHAVNRLEEMMQASAVTLPKIELLDPKGICPAESTRVQATEDPLVARALRLLDADAVHKMNINQLCSKLGVACSTLERHFRTALGVTPHRYLTKVRLDSAKKYLSAEVLSLEEIAASCGFSSRKRLNQTFRATEGISPRQWREQFAKEHES